MTRLDRIFIAAALGEMALVFAWGGYLVGLAAR